MTPAFTPPPLLEDPTHHLLALMDTPSPRQIIGIAGGPGSGKTTLATRLAAEINARTAPATVVALGMDGFHYPKATLRQFPDVAAAFARRGAPWTFDAAALEARLRQVQAAAGQADVAWPGFEHDVGDPVEAAFTVPAATRLVLVEGLYLVHQGDGWDAVSRLFDERWFLDVPLDVALERLALRHMQAWTISRAAAEQRIATNDRMNADIVRASMGFADWRVLG